MNEDKMNEKNIQQTKKKKKKKKGKKKIIVGLGIFVLLAVGIAVLSGVDKQDITKDVKKGTDAYLNQQEQEYLVYLYNHKDCGNCKNYKVELKKYQDSKGALPIYKVKSGFLLESVVENELFLDSRYPTLIHVVNNVEKYRYVGTFLSNELPKGNELPKKPRK